MSSAKMSDTDIHVQSSYEVLQKRAVDDVLEFESAVVSALKATNDAERDQAHKVIAGLRMKLIEKLIHPIRVCTFEQKSKLREQVKEFHEKFGHAVRSVPQIPEDVEEVRFRLMLIAEEFFELLQASCPGSPSFKQSVLYPIVRDAAIQVDLPAFVDAIRDTMYVLTGTELVFGVEGDEFGDDVHRANLSKSAVYVQTKDGYHKGSAIKPTKPADWIPPRTEEILRKQGWKG